MTQISRAQLQRLFGGGDVDAWVTALDSADFSDIAAVLASKAAGGFTGANLEGFRSAARVVVEARLAAQLTHELGQMQQLTDRMRTELADHVKAMNDSTTRLSKVGLGFTVVGLIIAVAQVFTTLAPKAGWQALLAAIAVALLMAWRIKRRWID